MNGLKRASGVRTKPSSSKRLMIHRPCETKLGVLLLMFQPLVCGPNPEPRFAMMPLNFNSLPRPSIATVGSASARTTSPHSGLAPTGLAVQRSSSRASLVAPVGLPAGQARAPSVSKAGASGVCAKRIKPWQMTPEAAQQLNEGVDRLIAHAAARGLSVYLSAEELLELKHDGLSDEQILLGLRLGASADTIRAFPAYQAAGIPINEHTLPSKTYCDASVMSSRSLNLPQ